MLIRGDTIACTQVMTFITGGSTMNSELKEILDLAINFEKESYVFYSGLVETIQNRALHGVLKDLATSEIGHRTKLENLMKDIEEVGQKVIVDMEPKEVQNLKLGDLLLPMDLKPGSSFQDVLIAAMKREGNAHEFYLNMQKLAKTEESRKLFEFLANEELEHKNIIEKPYDDKVYQEF
jgi:rubrerythrin